MNLIEKINKSIQFDKSISEQKENLETFDNLTNEEIFELTKYFKSSEAGILIKYLGWKKLKNYLPDFLEFLQDANWPASGYAAKMLTKSEEKIIPHIKKAFNKSGDYIWMYWIIVLIIQNWNKELIELIKPELIKTINVADDEYSSIESFSILKKNNIVGEKELNEYYNYLLIKYKKSNYLNKKDLIKELEKIVE